MNCDSGTRTDGDRDPKAGAVWNELLSWTTIRPILMGIGGVLRSERYFVLKACNGIQAIEAGETSGAISLLVTDMDLTPFVGHANCVEAGGVAEPRSSFHFWDAKSLVDQP
jgi:hypothetical protein